MFFKPTFTKSIATNNGWTDSKTGELLTSHKNLLTKLTDLGLDNEGNTKEVDEPIVKVKPSKKVAKVDETIVEVKPSKK